MDSSSKIYSKLVCRFPCCCRFNLTDFNKIKTSFNSLTFKYDFSFSRSYFFTIVYSTLGVILTEIEGWTMPQTALRFRQLLWSVPPPYWLPGEVCRRHGGVEAAPASLDSWAVPPHTHPAQPRHTFHPAS